MRLITPSESGEFGTGTRQHKAAAAGNVLQPDLAAVLRVTIPAGGLTFQSISAGRRPGRSTWKRTSRGMTPSACNRAFSRMSRVAEPALMMINPYPWSAPYEDLRLKK